MAALRPCSKSPKRLVGPNRLTQIVPADYLIRPFQESSKHLEWLILDPHPQTVLAQLPALNIDFKGPEVVTDHSSLSIMASSRQMR